MLARSAPLLLALSAVLRAAYQDLVLFAVALESEMTCDLDDRFVQLPALSAVVRGEGLRVPEPHAIETVSTDVRQLLASLPHPLRWDQLFAFEPFEGQPPPLVRLAST
jgi:hypothetical protein